MRLRMTRPARKHRVTVARVVAAMADAGTPTRDGDALTYIGRDAEGVEIEVVVVPDNRHEGGFSVIHAMPTHYRRNR